MNLTPEELKTLDELIARDDWGDYDHAVISYMLERLRDLNAVVAQLPEDCFTADGKFINGDAVYTLDGKLAWPECNITTPIASIRGEDERVRDYVGAYDCYSSPEAAEAARKEKDS